MSLGVSLNRLFLTKGLSVFVSPDNSFRNGRVGGVEPSRPIFTEVWLLDLDEVMVGIRRQDGGYWPLVSKIGEALQPRHATPELVDRGETLMLRTLVVVWDRPEERVEVRDYSLAVLAEGWVVLHDKFTLAV